MEPNEKEFIIPRNVDARFEIYKGIKLTDLPFFIPTTLLDYFLLFQLDNGTSVEDKISKALILGVIFLSPLVFVYYSPINRPDVKVWKMFYYKLRFYARQKKFFYGKDETK